jgi:hypothetical protein
MILPLPQRTFSPTSSTDAPRSLYGIVSTVPFGCLSPVDSV